MIDENVLLVHVGEPLQLHAEVLGKSLRGHVEHLGGPAAHLAVGLGVGVAVAAVHGRAGQAGAEGADLVVHEGYERGDDEDEAWPGCGEELVAERLGEEKKSKI